MSLLLVKDNANSKLRELECDANGLLKVDKVDVSSLATESTMSAMNAKITACDTSALATSALQSSGNTSLSSIDGKVTACNTGAVTVSSCALPSGAATESSLASIDGKVTACNTGAVTVSSCALPSGAATESSLASIDGKVTACNTGAVTVASSALPSGAATESSLASIDGKVTACDTGAVTVSSSALPTGASTASNQATGNASLATLAGCVSANVMSVSAGSVSSTGVYVWGSSSSTASISGSSSANSSVVDCNNFSRVCIAGSTSNLNDSNIELEVSINNTEFFELTDKFLSIDYNTGHFGIVLDAPFRYLRLKRSNTQLTSENIKAIIAGK